MQHRTRDGVTLHVQELGSGPPVVMVHGLLLGNMATWYWTAAPALAARHRVIIFDLRGHGLSERVKTGYDVATMTRDLASIVDDIAGEPVALVGHSYGAAIALTYAIRNPDRVTKLVVVEAPLPPSHLEELDGFLGQSPGATVDALPDIEAVVGSGFLGPRFAESLRFLVGESTLLADVRRAEDVPDTALAALQPPLLAVYGTESSCRSTGARLARVVPGAQLVELQGGHFLPAAAPGPLTAALTKFLDGS